MSYEFWVDAERWYEQNAAIVLATMALILLVLIFASSKRKTKTGRIILVVGVVTEGLLGGLTIFNNNRYDAYLEPASHVTALVRHEEFQFLGGYQPIMRSYKDRYLRYHDPEGVEATGLYEREDIEVPVTYLGKSGRIHFFQYEDVIFKQYETTVRFDETASETLLMGSRYHLEDNQYKEIGFVDPPYIFYEQIKIAGADTKKEYNPIDEGLLPNVKEAFYEWTAPYY